MGTIYTVANHLDSVGGNHFYLRKRSFPVSRLFKTDFLKKSFMAHNFIFHSRSIYGSVNKNLQHLTVKTNKKCILLLLLLLVHMVHSLIS